MRIYRISFIDLNELTTFIWWFIVYCLEKCLLSVILPTKDSCYWLESGTDSWLRVSRGKWFTKERIMKTSFHRLTEIIKNVSNQVLEASHLCPWQAHRLFKKYLMRTSNCTLLNCSLMCSKCADTSFSSPLAPQAWNVGWGHQQKNALCFF